MGGNPSLIVELAGRRRTEVATGNIDGAVGQFHGCKHVLFHGQKALVHFFRVLRLAVDKHLQLVELVDAQDAASVLTVGAGLAAEAGGPAGVEQRAVGQVDDLVLPVEYEVVEAQQQVDQANADHKVALATVEADKAQLRSDEIKLDYTTIKAPISGRTGLIHVTPGNLVSSSDPNGLVTITQVRPIRVNFTMAERDLSLIRKAYITKPPAVVRVYAPGENEALASGELEFLDSAVDTASGTIAVKAKFANEDFKLWPGMYVDVEIDLSKRPNTVMIPAVAIQSGQSGPFVFVVKDGKTAEMRKVELAGVEGDRAALASGVNDGENVIVEGQMRLVDGARVVEGTSSNSGKAAGATQPTQSEVAK